MRLPASSRVARAIGRIGITSGIALMLVLALSPTVVGAAAAPRLSGSWTVTLTITAQQNSYNTVGQKVTKPWVFTPQCASGGCNTTLDRTRGDDTVSHYTMKPVLKNGKWQYKTSATQKTNCYENGNLVLAKAYAAAEKIVLKPGTVTSGNVASFTGTYNLVLTATSQAKALGCKDGYVKGTFKNKT